jgi:hypothetical protein
LDGTHPVSRPVLKKSFSGSAQTFQIIYGGQLLSLESEDEVAPIVHITRCYQVSMTLQPDSQVWLNKLMGGIHQKLFLAVDKNLSGNAKQMTRILGKQLLLQEFWDQAAPHATLLVDLIPCCLVISTFFDMISGQCFKSVSQMNQPSV